MDKAKYLKQYNNWIPFVWWFEYLWWDPCRAQRRCSSRSPTPGSSRCSARRWSRLHHAGRRLWSGNNYINKVLVACSWEKYSVRQAESKTRTRQKQKNKHWTRMLIIKTKCLGWAEFLNFKSWYARHIFYCSAVSICFVFMIKDLIELVKYLFRFLKENVPLFHFHVRALEGRLWGRGGPGCQGKWVVVVSMAKMLVLRKLQVNAMFDPAV